MLQSDLPTARFVYKDTAVCKHNLTCELFLIFQSTVDKLIKKTNLALLIGTNSWREQFVEAITVNSGTNSVIKSCA